MSDGYVFIDTETNGRGSKARVIEIALVQTSLSGERQMEFTSLIRGDGYSGGSRLFVFSLAQHRFAPERSAFARFAPGLIL